MPKIFLGVSNNAYRKSSIFYLFLRKVSPQMTCEGVTKLLVMEILGCQPSSGMWKSLNKKHNLKIILVILVS